MPFQSPPLNGWALFDGAADGMLGVVSTDVVSAMTVGAEPDELSDVAATTETMPIAARAPAAASSDTAFVFATRADCMKDPQGQIQVLGFSGEARSLLD